MKFNTFSTWEFNPDLHSHDVQGVSLTVPDDSYSVQDLLRSFTHSGSFPVSAYKEYYDDTEDIDPFDNPDFELTDYEALKAEYDSSKKVISGDSHEVKNTDAKGIKDEGAPEAAFASNTAQASE